MARSTRLKTCQIVRYLREIRCPINLNGLEVKKLKWLKESEATHTGAKILNVSKNYHFGNLILNKIHILKVPFLTKITFSKSHFWQNSHFQNLIFDKIHIFKISFLTKFTLSKSHFWKNSHFQNIIFHKIHIFKV